jgi:hypothetical protein
MDPQKLKLVLGLCERIQEAAAEIFETFNTSIEKHSDIMPDEEVLSEIAPGHLFPELVQAGQIPVPKGKATDAQVAEMSKLEVWNQMMSIDVSNAEPELIAQVGSMMALTNRLSDVVGNILTDASES